MRAFAVALLAAPLLAQHGRDVRNLDGGFRTWRAGIRSQVATLEPIAG